jgi:hypothetical protein
LTHWLVSEDVIRDCRERGRRYDQEVETVARRVGAAAIATLWLMLMAAGTVWLYKS